MKEKTILVVEDSYTSILLLDETLKTKGYKTQLALTAKEAIEKIKNKLPDLIILDLNMPEINGYDFLEMKDQLNIENIPVIIVSALDSPESIHKSKSLGASDFIPKPVKLDLLLRKVKDLIDL